VHTNFDACDMDDGLEPQDGQDVDEIEEFEDEYDVEYEDHLECDECGHKGAFDMGHAVLCLEHAREDLDMLILSDEEQRRNERKQMGLCNF